MQYKAYVFDIDGTLLPHGEGAPSFATQQAIINAQNSGIKIIVATGRAYFSAKSVMGNIKPDYYIASNGSQIINGTGAYISTRHFKTEEMYALCDYCDNFSLPLAFAFEDGYYIYCESEEYLRQYGNIAGCHCFMRAAEDRVRHLQNMPFSACVQANEQHILAFNQKYNYLNLRFVPFGNGGFNDVFSGEVNKAIAMQNLQSVLNISLQEIAAFGDGHNDLELARECGLSVCVGNACPELTTLANMHTDIANLEKIINNITF